MFKHLFIYIAVLNVLDGLITLYGLNHSFISEANPIMYGLYQLDPFLFMVTKIGLSVLLLLLIDMKQTTLLKGLALTASVAYTFVFFLHGFWLFQI